MQAGGLSHYLIIAQAIAINCRMYVFVQNQYNNPLFVTRFYRTEPNRTSGKIKLTHQAKSN